MGSTVYSDQDAAQVEFHTYTPAGATEYDLDFRAYGYSVVEFFAYAAGQSVSMKVMEREQEVALYHDVNGAAIPFGAFKKDVWNTIGPLGGARNVRLRVTTQAAPVPTEIQMMIKAKR